MREIRTISLDPYINDGGILGTQLEVNQPAADKILSAVSLSKNVVVTRGEKEQVGYNPQGTDAISLSKSDQHKAFTSVLDGKLSAVQENPAHWEVVVFDQDIHTAVDKNLVKKFRSGKGVSRSAAYATEYARILSRETSVNIGKAGGKEKNRRLHGSYGLILRRDIALVVGLGTLGGAGFLAADALTSFDNIDSIPDLGLFFLEAISAYGLTIFGSAVMNATFSIFPEDSNLEKWEFFLSNFQLRNRLQGMVAIEMNKDKLIQINSQP